MRRRFSYADALKVLGSHDRKIIEVLDKTSSAVAVGTGNFQLLGARGELIRFGRLLVSKADERLTGANRMDRIERLIAAHSIIVVTAFFEAFDNRDWPLTSKTIDLTSSEQVRLFGTKATSEGNKLNILVQELLYQELPAPSPMMAISEYMEQLRATYERATDTFWNFLTGLDIWESLSDGHQHRLTESKWDLPAEAMALYRQLCNQLASDNTEFYVWLKSSADEYTQRAVDSLAQSVDNALFGIHEKLADSTTALASLKILVEGIPKTRVAGKYASALSASYQATLNRPPIDAADMPEGVTMPNIGDLYVDPRFRVLTVSPDTNPAQESSWRNMNYRRNLGEYVLGYLSSSSAADTPLIVLGQPGSGKSLFTRVLSAHLVAENFLPVVVSFRDLSSDLDIQALIEQSIRSITGEQAAWPQIVRTEEGVQPVVIFDGFDELLQTTGKNHADFLMKLALFQERERDQGRPLAVILTSRIAVANRARFPPSAIVLRLDSFDERQISRWLKAWNSSNAAHFGAKSLRPLPAELVHSNLSLAQQPLLLLMLALFDAVDNALQQLDHSIGRSGLYERLLQRFTRREVMRSGGSLPEESIDALVDVELERLSITSFAMLNRGAQWITDDELNRDLESICPVPEKTVKEDVRSLTASQVVIGRFFFIHEAKVISNKRPLFTYEFLHSTFGEYLIARYIERALNDMCCRDADRETITKLQELMSYSLICNQTGVLGFLDELFDAVGVQQRDSITDTVLHLLRESMGGHQNREPSQYLPRSVTMPKQNVFNSVNWLVILVTLKGRLPISELFDSNEDCVKRWAYHASIWHSELSEQDWDSFCSATRFDRIWGKNDKRDAILTLYGGRLDSDVNAADDIRWSFGADRFEHVIRLQSTEIDEIRRDANILCDFDRDIFIHSLRPLASASLVGIFVPTEGTVQNVICLLLDTWLISATSASPELRVSKYLACAKSIRDVSPAMRSTCTALVVGMLLQDTLLERDQLGIVLGELDLNDDRAGIAAAEVALKSVGANPDVNLICYRIFHDVLEGCERSNEWLQVRIWVRLHELRLAREARIEADLFINNEVFLSSINLEHLASRDPGLADHARRLGDAGSSQAS